jgi:hypothetical protein
MPSGPIGTSWASGSWEVTAWEAGSWADLGSVVAPTVFEDLTTVFVPYVASLLAAHGGQDDASTQVAKDLPTVRAAAASNNLDDANTMYAAHLS